MGRGGKVPWRAGELQAIERATEAIRLGCMDDTQLAQRVIDSAYAPLGWSQSG